MLGEPLSLSVRHELERRKKALSRDSIIPDIKGDTLNYSFAEMMTKTTYVRLISPLYGTEIAGTLLKNSDPYNNFNQKHWLDWNESKGSSRGHVPPPGISSVRTAYMGEGATINTIKEASIELKVYSNEQYNKIIPEFVRIGRIIYLEFGWSNPRIDIIRAQAVPRDFLRRTFDSQTGEHGVELDYEKTQHFPGEFAVNTNGNSDILVGSVSNYSAKLNEAGGYDITLDLKTSGHGLYYASTNKKKHQSIPLLTDNVAAGDERANQTENAEQIASNKSENDFNNTLDERNGLILLSKIKQNLQEVFDIAGAFEYPVLVKDKSSDKEEYKKEPLMIEQPSVFYLNDKEHNEYMEKCITHLETRGFSVEKVYAPPENPLVGRVAIDEETMLYAQQRAMDKRKLLGFTAIHIAYRDLIITCMDTGETTKIGEEDGKGQIKVNQCYINYYCSIKYIEDNILSRLFGTADANSEIIVSGVRSLHVAQEKVNAGMKFPKDNSTPFLNSNLMLTHKQLVPSSFTDCLINTEAMSALLQRTHLGFYGTNSDAKQTKEMANYSKALGKTLQEAFPFEIGFSPTTAAASIKAKKRNPNHVLAKIRNMYVNVNVLQEAFLGDNNSPFCDRNFYPTTSRDGSTTEIEAWDEDPWWYIFFAGDDRVTFYQDESVTFDKMSCVGSVREGLINFYNRISDNFHGFPNFEVGANVHLPGFLQVYDLRTTKTDDYYEFEVYSKDSLVKSLELNSKIPKNVELAATIGASTKFDLTDALGGVNSGLNPELLHDLELSAGKQKAFFNPLHAASYGSTDYIKGLGDIDIATADVGENNVLAINPSDSPGTIEATIRYGIENGLLSQYAEYSDKKIEELTNAVFDGQTTIEFNNGGSYTGQAEIEQYTDDAWNYLKVVRDSYTKSFQGIAPGFIKQNRPPTDEGSKNSSADVAEDKKVRDKYPNINEGLAHISDTMDKLFLLKGRGTEKVVDKKDGEPSVNLGDDGQSGATITGIPAVDVSGNMQLATLEQFHLTFSKVVSPNAKEGVTSNGARKAPYISIGTHSDYQSYMDQLIYNDNVQSLEKLNNTISYFELTFKIDGISGILPGQSFTVSYLPEMIERNFFFIVSNIEQELTSEGWTTTITGLMRRRDMPLPKQPSKLKVKMKAKKKSDKKKLETIKVQPKPKPKPVVDPDPGFPPSDNRPLPRDDDSPIPGAEDDGLDTDLDMPDPAQTNRDFIDPPPPQEDPPPKEKVDPPPVRPSIPVPTDDEDIADDVVLDELEFDDFSDWDVPDPPPPFMPYTMVENDTANIVLQMTDGQVSIQPFKDAPQQDVKIYPKGRENSHPITFSLGVTDVLSIEEFNNIAQSYYKAFGKDPRELLNRLYTRVSIKDREGPEGNSNFGEWDKRDKIYFYVANRKDKDGVKITTKINELQKTLQAQVGNDPDNTTGIDNDYLNDVVMSILNQPERTKLTVLKDKKKNDRKNIVIKRPREPFIDPRLRDPDFKPPGSDPPPAPAKKKKPKKQPPAPSTFFGGLSWQNDILYSVVPKWRTLGAAMGITDEKKITDKTRIDANNRGIYYKKEIFYGHGKEAKPEDPVPFDVRRDFWDQMIEPRASGGHYDKSDKAKASASKTTLQNDSTYNYLKRITGTEWPASNPIYRWEARF